jgi:hypothetical protein
MPKRITTNQFIIKANKVHNYKYDYSKSIYVCSRTPVDIICPIHGTFQKTPQDHVVIKCGCSKCFFDKKRNTKEEFIKKAVEKHGNIYDYSKVDYKNNAIDVIIVCKEHGDFTQRPSRHTSGVGCAKCSVDRQKTSLNEFIYRSIEKHGSIYDYSKVDYKNNKVKVTIHCKKHGDFTQRPPDHMRGQGCPKCGKCRISRCETGFLDHINIANENRQYTVLPTRYQVDGICLETKTIYEFLGDYWHGNPKLYNRDLPILNSKLSCGDAYDRTFNRFKKLKTMGYTVKYIWENDWKEWSKNKMGDIPIQEYA